MTTPLLVLCSFTLGSKPPMVTGVKLYRNASPGVAEGAFMDIDTLWSGNQVRLVTCNSTNYYCHYYYYTFSQALRTRYVQHLH